MSFPRILKDPSGLIRFCSSPHSNLPGAKLLMTTSIQMQASRPPRVHWRFLHSYATAKRYIRATTSPTSTTTLRNQGSQAPKSPGDAKAKNYLLTAGALQPAFPATTASTSASCPQIFAANRYCSRSSTTTISDIPTVATAATDSTQQHGSHTARATTTTTTTTTVCGPTYHENGCRQNAADGGRCDAVHSQHATCEHKVVTSDRVAHKPEASEFPPSAAGHVPKGRARIVRRACP